MRITKGGHGKARGSVAALWAALVALVALAAPGAAAERPTAGAAPLRLSGGQVLGYIAVPDLQGLLSHVEAASEAAAPGSVPPGAARAGLAQKLGAAGLEGLAARPLLLVLLQGAGPMAPPRPVLFLPVKDAKAYEPTIAGLGWKSRTAPGLLIASSTPEGLQATAPLEAEYRRITTAGIPHDLRVFLQVNRVMDAYGPLIQLGLDAATAKARTAPEPGPETAAPSKPGPGRPSGPGRAAGPSPEAAAKILKLEIKAFVAVLNQLDDVQWDIDLKPESFDSDTAVTARAGSALADLAAMAPPQGNRAAALLSGSGFMTAAYDLDPAKTAAFLNAVVKESAADPEAAQLLTPEVSALLEQVAAVYGGQTAYRMAAAPGSPLAVETVMKVADEAGAVALVERAMALIAPGGAWAPLLEGTGMSMTLQKAARRHAGISVHRLKVRVDPKGLTPEQKAARAAFLRDSEFAVAGGYYVSAQDPVALDRLIDRAVSGAPAEGLTLTSARAFGEGRHGYVDYDLIGLMKAASAMTPTPKGQSDPFASLPASGAPMLSALTFGEGRIRWQSSLPLRPFVLITEASKKAAASPAPGGSPLPPPKAPSPAPPRRP